MPGKILRANVFDVIVVGGGPAGSACAALLAQQGFDVLLLEKEKFPRYHVGESLITGCVGIVDRLGIRDRLDELGFVKKPGGTLVWGEDGRWTFGFREGGPKYPNAYNVRRADFDALLLARARELGVHVLEEAAVKESLRDRDRIAGVRYAVRGEDTTEAHAKIVVDASGQSRVLARELTEVRWQDDLRNVAVWSYFQDGERLGGEEEGNIFLEHVPGGWFWYIPLHDGTHSVGYVTGADAASSTGQSLPQLFDAKVVESTHLSKLLHNATRVASFRTARDWSYTANQFAGPGWMLAGDAAAFVDPLFSTGVTLGMLAAGAVADAVPLVLADPSRESQIFDKYETSYRDFLDNILSFVRFFYDAALSKEAYYQYAQALVDPGKLFFPREDFVTLISGLNSLRPIFDLTPEAESAR